MKKTILFTTLIFVSLINFGQLKNDLSLAARGKIFGFFVIEDAYFSTGTLGLELIYKNKHSIGIDYTFFNWQYQTDGDKEDSLGNWQHDIPLFNEYERRSYFLIDYKYSFSKLNRDVFWYINAYNKYGSYRQWYGDWYNEELLNRDPGFLNSITKGRFNEVGLGIGFKTYFKDYNLGFDMSGNFAVRTSKNDITNRSVSNLEVISKDVRDTKYLPYLRINFFYRFGYNN